MPQSSQQNGRNISEDVSYRRAEIHAARFGNENKKPLLDLAYQIKERLNKRIFGQSKTNQAIQDRMVQYFSGRGSRTKDPIHINLVGLPGIGKSALVNELEEMGLLKILRFDVQNFTGPSKNAEQEGGSLEDDLFYRINNFIDENSDSDIPVAILFDEIDKAPEIIDGGEVSRKIIGVLNTILTDGKLTSGSEKLVLSNNLIVTTMNLSPRDIQNFSEEVLGAKKDYYDYSIEDLKKLDTWLTKEPSARYKVLSKLFRLNTISRLGPNTIVMSPLDHNGYDPLVQLKVQEAISKNTTGENEARRLEVEYTPEFLKELYKLTVFPPSGARETVARADLLTEQLIQFGMRATVPGDYSLDRPRILTLDFDQSAGSFTVKVTGLAMQGRETLVKKSDFTIPVEYDHSSRFFIQPSEVKGEISDFPQTAEATERQRRKTLNDIRNARYSKNALRAKGLAKHLNSIIFGQEKITEVIERDMMAYLGRSGNSPRGIPFLALGGFTGIGKSELITQTAKYLNLPVIEINLQMFGGENQDTVTTFLNFLAKEFEKASIASPDGKYILNFLEMDKIFELHGPEIIQRPVIAVIKDILDKGVVNVPAPNAYDGTRKIDLRGAFGLLDMNFKIDLFGFEADPRLTTIQDTITAYHRLTRPADLKAILGSLFLPETVGRLMPRFYVLKPLEKEDYIRVINKFADQTINLRFGIREDQFAESGISIKLTSRYRKYLYDEGVIPSEGGRRAAKITERIVQSDLERAISHYPRTKPYDTQPTEITLDFDPLQSVVSARLQLVNRPKGTRSKLLFKEKVELSFPRMEVSGTLPEERLHTAAHEFGHAYTAVRLGVRFEEAVAVPPKNGVGGYVKMKSLSVPMRGTDIIASLYSTLGSRALERIISSDTPLSDHSYSQISTGPASDISNASASLWSYIYLLGLAPQYGTLERSGGNYASYESLPSETVDQLAWILRDMEDVILRDMLSAHPMDWYVEKISAFAYAGAKTEKDFYQMIGYIYPGDNALPIVGNSRTRTLFKNFIQELPKEIEEAGKFKQGLTATTAAENRDRFMELFMDSLNKRMLHNREPNDAEKLNNPYCTHPFGPKSL